MRTLATYRAVAGPRSDPIALADGPRWGSARACQVVTGLLCSRPDRLAHSLLAGRQALRVRATVSEADRELLVSAALLHDIGYSPALAATGFHPLDGATYLLAAGAPARLAALVAHHSESRFLADAAGFSAELSRFHRENGPVMDALVYADMTAGPRGEPMSVPDRLADIAARHAGGEPHLRAARLARVPHLLAATERVRIRITLSAPVWR